MFRCASLFRLVSCWIAFDFSRVLAAPQSDNSETSAPIPEPAQDSSKKPNDECYFCLVQHAYPDPDVPGNNPDNSVRDCSTTRKYKVDKKYVIVIENELAYSFIAKVSFATNQIETNKGNNAFSFMDITLEGSDTKVHAVNSQIYAPPLKSGNNFMESNRKERQFLEILLFFFLNKERREKIPAEVITHCAISKYFNEYCSVLDYLLVNLDGWCYFIRAYLLAMKVTSNGDQPTETNKGDQPTETNVLDLFEKISDFEKISSKYLLDNIQHILSLERFKLAVYESVDQPDKVDVKAVFETLQLLAIAVSKFSKDNFVSEENQVVSLIKQGLMKLLYTILKKLKSKGSTSSTQQVDAAASTKPPVDLTDVTRAMFLPTVFSAFSLFSPAEISKLDRDLFKNLVLTTFESQLFYLFEIDRIHGSNEELGILGLDSLSECRENMKNSKGFISTHFRFGRKVWIHFGIKTIDRIVSTLGESLFPVFWECIRTYVIVSGGDGILMTFEGKSAEAKNSTLFLKLRCGFWNLTDLTKIGNVVFYEGEIEMQSENENNADAPVFLRLFANSYNMNVLVSETSAIVLFYKKKEDDESNKLIKALPNRLCAKPFDIQEDSKKGLLCSKKVESCIQEMLNQDCYKVTLLISLDVDMIDYCLEIMDLNNFDFGTGICERNKNRKKAIEQICECLIRLSQTCENFRELHFEILGDENRQTEDAINNMLKKIKLKTLDITSSVLNINGRASTIIDVITSNQYMMNNLEYIEIKPFVLDDKGFKLLMGAPLKKISMMYGNSYFNNPRFDKAFKSLCEKECLQEIEVYFSTTCEFRTGALNLIRSIHLERFTVWCDNFSRCKEIFSELVHREDDEMQNAGNIQKSICLANSVFFSYYACTDQYGRLVSNEADKTGNKQVGNELVETRSSDISHGFKKEILDLFENDILSSFSGAQAFGSHAMCGGHITQKGSPMVRRCLSVN